MNFEHYSNDVFPRSRLNHARIAHNYTHVPNPNDMIKLQKKDEQSTDVAEKQFEKKEKNNYFSHTCTPGFQNLQLDSLSRFLNHETRVNV